MPIGQTLSKTVDGDSSGISDDGDEKVMGVKAAIRNSLPDNNPNDKIR